MIVPFCSPMESFSGKDGKERKMWTIHHENMRKCCPELSELSSKKTTDVFIIKDNSTFACIISSRRNLRNTQKKKG